MNIIEKSKQYACVSHANTNHYYDYDKPYSTHLEMVYNMAKHFISLVNDEDHNDVLAACWTHDIIEDARQTYNDVLENTNRTVAELTYALTNEKGRNRLSRANKEYYEGIRHFENASFIKLCDRIANVTYSKQSKSGMYLKYKKENDHFIASIDTYGLTIMVEYLDNIFNNNTNVN